LAIFIFAKKVLHPAQSPLHFFNGRHVMAFSSIALPRKSKSKSSFQRSFRFDLFSREIDLKIDPSPSNKCIAHFIRILDTYKAFKKMCKVKNTLLTTQEMPTVKLCPQRVFPQM